MSDAVERDLTVSERPNDPQSHGWLRRRDLDSDDGEAWELPDGAIRLTVPAGFIASPQHLGSKLPEA